MNPLIILTGPTAVGKSELAVMLAKAVGGEIISADSMQVYKGMDIGSAKITAEQMQGVRHYLIDELSPLEEFNVVLFQRYAVKYMREIYERGRIPILVGGTGFYIQSVLYDVDFCEHGEDRECREELERLGEERGPEYLHEQLRVVDPASADAIHPNNIKRVIRALEFYRQTGRTISGHNREQRERRPSCHAAYFVLNEDRQVLYERIDRRVDRMLQSGLLDEVKELKAQGCTKDMVSMQGLGYKEMLSYLDGETTYEEAVRELKRDTRHFAKRQLTWFRREKEVIWIEKEAFGRDSEKILEFMLCILKERGIWNG